MDDAVQNTDHQTQDRPHLSAEELRDFVRFIVLNLVMQRDQVDVAVMEDMPGVYSVHVKVSPEDKGRVIGKSGNNINAIRTLVKVFGRISVLVQD